MILASLHLEFARPTLLLALLALATLALKTMLEWKASREEARAQAADRLTSPLNSATDA